MVDVRFSALQIRGQALKGARGTAEESVSGRGDLWWLKPPANRRAGSMTTMANNSRERRRARALYSIAQQVPGALGKVRASSVAICPAHSGGDAARSSSRR